MATASVPAASTDISPNATIDTQTTTGFRVPNLGHALAGEFTRLAGLRSTYIYAILLTGAIFGPIVLQTYLSGVESGTLFVGIDFFLFVAIIFAAADSAGAISGRNIAYGYLTRQGRWTGYATRFLAQLAFSLAMLAVGTAVAWIIFATGGVEIVDAAQTVGVVIALAVAWTAIGSGIGMLIPVTAAAVAAPLVWIALIEGILPMLPFGDFMNNIERFLPWISGRQLLGFMDLGVSNAQAWIVLGTWTAVIAAVGIVTATRRDVR